MKALSNFISSIFSVFSRPYPIDGIRFGSLFGAIIDALITGAVVMFLNPFNFNDQSSVLYAALTAFGISFVMRVLAGLVLKTNASSWTIMGQLLLQVVIFVVIGVAISQIFKGEMSGLPLLAGAGAVISFIYLLVNQGAVQNKNISIANNASDTLKSNPVSVGEIQQVPMQLSGKQINMLPNQIISVQKAGDNVVINWQNMKNTEQSNLHLGFDKFAKTLMSEANFLQCNDSMIVNVNAIRNVIGDAHGLKIEIAKTNEVIEISPVHVAEFKKRFA